MASDIVPIQLSLTDGDVVTLWAPTWREDGEEWEAFLGDEDNLFVFPDVAQLAAFVRTEEEHDLIDHPAWSIVPGLSVAELTPEENQSYDVVGLPEIAAEEPDTWTLQELSEIVEIVRSIADVCDLEPVHAVLDSTPGFAALGQGTLPFTGREGQKLWAQLVDTIADKWDDVIDALDDLVATPDVDGTALAAATKEREAQEAADAEAEAADAEAATATDEDGPDAEDSDEPDGFWDEIGIDPIRITTGTGDVVTLRCYVDDTPVFLGTKGKIDVFPNERALARWLAGDDGVDGHDLAAVSTWAEVVEQASVGELEVEVDPLNHYVLTGLVDDIAEGTMDVDPTQLELATELLLDVADWAGDDEPRRALADSQPLGWLVSFVVRPNPTRLAPSPPFDAESAKLRELLQDMEDRFTRN